MLDLGLGSPEDVATNLAEMWRINRYLGGLRALTSHLYPRLAASPDGVTVADLGSGSGEVPVAIARWARKRDLNVRILAVDWAGRNLAVTRANVADTPEVSLLQADANRMPLPPCSVDYVISSLFIHHFAPVQAVGVLRAAYLCARRAIIMSDLVRGWLPLVAFKLVQPIFAHNFLTRHDGALSIRRSYTPAELRQLAEAAGLHNARVHTHWPWRMTLVADR